MKLTKEQFLALAGLTAMATDSPSLFTDLPNASEIINKVIMIDKAKRENDLNELAKETLIYAAEILMTVEI